MLGHAVLCLFNIIGKGWCDCPVQVDKPGKPYTAMQNEWCQDNFNDSKDEKIWHSLIFKLDLLDLFHFII